jgi:hypothetical protein
MWQSADPADQDVLLRKNQAADVSRRQNREQPAQFVAPEKKANRARRSEQRHHGRSRCSSINSGWQHQDPSLAWSRRPCRED